MGKLRIVAAAVAITGSLCAIATPASATNGWQGTASPTLYTTYCYGGSLACVVGVNAVDAAWYMWPQAYAVAVSGGWKTYQTSYEGFQENWYTDPAAPIVQSTYTDAYDGGTFIDSYGPTQSGCLAALIPSSWLQSPCGYSNYNSSGHVFAAPHLENCSVVGATGVGWDYYSGQWSYCYYYLYL